MQKQNHARKISILALFAAIIIIQNYVPLVGYIPVGMLEITTIHITVIVAAILLGPVDGGIVGGIWGLVDWLRAITVTSSALGNVVMVNPLISIVPRILIGVITGWLVNWLIKTKLPQQVTFIISSVLGSLVNTVLVLSLIYVFYHNGSQVYAALNLKELMPYLLTVAGVHGIPEAIAAGIIAPLLAVPLLKYSKVGQQRFKQ
ncbi:ECF transporter S component [Pediococcus acidilactici]|jgi:uncharacterized membrane protein|uniref:ECF transporter S component n=2 Tax=Pediococcus acidilactici TaxID=1254 RepID=E0NFA3_PEDAC|nr:MULTISPECIES: ECF transporter S component [Pediococcus]AZP91127.1 ECF transporter S component [Pediococcus acidilactici]EFA26323.1 hypothetical protein HMPREF9024_01275 [Pediococcus acidilactici 7_4]EFL95797.1 hypothetical protein HMPREF0623_0833 [Pediococcus acidilactici DSM 20284]KAF0366513.1 ECF transporter S component [Pediococcus acidilactici]KAF0370794.1 ECF transporter S component [Pediococcus acidilactici]